MAYLNISGDRFQEPRDTPRAGPEEFTYKSDGSPIKSECWQFGMTDEYRANITVANGGGYTAGVISMRQVIGGKLAWRALDETQPVERFIAEAIRAYLHGKDGQEALADAWEQKVEEEAE